MKIEANKCKIGVELEFHFWNASHNVQFNILIWGIQFKFIYSSRIPQLHADCSWSIWSRQANQLCIQISQITGHVHAHIDTSYFNVNSGWTTPCALPRWCSWKMTQLERQLVECIFSCSLKRVLIKQTVVRCRIWAQLWTNKY